MKNVEYKLRVVHIPQVPMKGFIVKVENEGEAFLVSQTLAKQHLWLFENKVIPDYSNLITVEMFANDEWVDYYNRDSMMDWDEVAEVLFNQ